MQDQDLAFESSARSLPPLPTGPPPPLPGPDPRAASPGGFLASPLPPHRPPGAPQLPPGPPPPLQGSSSVALRSQPSMESIPASSAKSVLGLHSGIAMPSIRPSPSKMRSPSMEELDDGSFTIPSARPQGGSADQPFRIQVATWNMNKTAPSEPLADAFLQCNLEDAVPDLFVVATQESGPLPALSAALERSLGIRAPEGGQGSLGPEQQSFEHVATETLWDISVSIYRHKRLSIQVLRSESIATGVGNVLGNKGAVGVGLLVGGATRLLLISSHFAAHDDKVAERNADYARIVEGLFSTPQKDVTADYDVTVWAGDFNYRVNSNRRAADMLIQNEMWEVMMANEQLKQERDKGNTFKGFQEGGLHFAPTFKFDPGTDHYDTSSKARVPSWTDRILWKCNPSTHPGSVKLLRYDSIPEMRESDHRPVIASLEVQPCKKVDSGSDGEDAATDNSSKMCVIQ